MPVAGVHLVPTLARRGAWRSAVAVVGDDGRVEALRMADGDEEVAAGVPEGSEVLCVDAPLAVPDARGQRDVERVLAWCDVPAFPVSGDRLRTVHGGARGVGLRPLLAARAGRVLEAPPDLVLRQLMWERDTPPEEPPMDLAAYRERWIAVRPPAFRGRAGGRAGLPGLLRAYAIVAAAIDLGGWAPDPEGDDWTAIHDAARLDAVLCAYAAWRVREGGAVVLGTPERGEVAVPAGVDLRARIAVNLERLRAEGVVRI